MKNTLFKKAKSPAAIVPGTLLIVIFMAAMKHPMKDKDAYTYLALGDSYTIGEQVPTKENFPNQVCHLLDAKGLHLKTPKIIAKTGWTTDELQDAIKKEKIVSPYDFVTLLIGVNNQYRGRTTDNYIPEFESLLKQAIHFAGDDPTHVVVLSIPDWGATPFAKGRDSEQIAREIDAYNKVNKAIADSMQVHYIDITPQTREAANDNSLVAADGLHPSGREYGLWAESIAAVIQKIISGQE